MSAQSTIAWKRSGDSWLEDPSAAPSWRDRGISHGLGLFETMLAIDDRIPLLNRHLKRLAASCMKLGWDPGLPDLKAAFESFPGSGTRRLRLVLTSGSGPLDDAAAGDDRIAVLSIQPVEAPAETPLSLTISPHRLNEHSITAGLKTASYAEPILARSEARARGFDDALLLNTSEHLAEATMANVFLVRDGGILTPPLRSGCLPGISRELVISLAAEHGIHCEQRDLTADDIHAADACFLTSSLRGVAAVDRVDDTVFRPCALTGRLQGLWRETMQA